MSCYSGNGDRCPYCELSYRDFRTGFTYRGIFELMMDCETDPKLWRNKRRRTVLGKWHQLKRELWTEHTELGACPLDPRNVEVLRVES